MPPSERAACEAEVIKAYDTSLAVLSELLPAVEAGLVEALRSAARNVQG